MSIKNLFGKSFKGYESASVDVESPTLINNEVENRDVYIPPVDFATASNFVRYGSAKLYYENSIERIYLDYPYDGSNAEKVSFHLSSSYLDRWMFDEKYPKTTGYVTLGSSAGYSTKIDGYASTSTQEYIRTWGGLHTGSAGMDAGEIRKNFDSSTKYDPSLNRGKTWPIVAVSGTTVEFWLKKGTFNTSNTDREVILDLWNGELSSSSDYGRFTLELTGGSGACFQATLHSGSSGFTTASVCSATITTSSLSSWHHYALSFVSASTGGTNTTFYVDGVENLTGTFGSPMGDIGGLITGYIGALQTAPSSSTDAFASTSMAGGAKFAGSLDEFRFWKTARTGREIGLHWFKNVGGGANTDVNTTDLGVYYKFNEGITTSASIDSTILDYSGRIANGLWVGYPGSSMRSTKSAMNLSSYALTESKSPIIYSVHPRVVSLKSEMLTSGSNYDNISGSSLYYSMPNWLVDSDLDGNQNLMKLTQIMGSYFDTLYAQITALPSLKEKQYIQPKYKAAPFANELLRDKGFITSNILVNSEVVERFANADINAHSFANNIDEIKNLIYTNIYNNLEGIYKSKGTEKSIRNLIRCFGIDDEIIKLNVYTDGGTHYFTDKAKGTSVKKKYINFASTSSFSATLYQTSSTSNSLTFISGSTGSFGPTADGTKNAFTFETDIMVPYRAPKDDVGFLDVPFLSSSIFGFHQVKDEQVPTDYTWASSDEANLQTYLLRDELQSTRAKFVLKKL